MINVSKSWSKSETRASTKSSTEGDFCSIPAKPRQATLSENPTTSTALSVTALAAADVERRGRTETAIELLCQGMRAVTVDRDYLISPRYLLHVTAELTALEIGNSFLAPRSCSGRE